MGADSGDITIANGALRVEVDRLERIIYRYENLHDHAAGYLPNSPTRTGLLVGLRAVIDALSIDLAHVHKRIEKWERLGRPIHMTPEQLSEVP